MGWEHRIFFRPLPEAGKVFGQQQSWQQEKRTDIYHPHSPAVGIKERGVAYSEIDRAWANDVEVKFRKEVDEAGFEKWKKKRVRGEEELNRELCENGHVGLQAVSSMSRCSTVVKLEKSRRKEGSNECFGPSDGRATNSHEINFLLLGKPTSLHASQDAEIS